VSLGDVLSIDWDGIENGLTFMKEAEGALVPMTSPVPDTLAEAAAAISDGRELSFPAPATAAAELTPPVSAQRALAVEKIRNEKR
jgi:hypothetical protein